MDKFDTLLFALPSFLGRETHNTPDLSTSGEYHLVGCVVGAVERGVNLPQQERIVEGDVLIGIASSGLHSQGFGLVRKILLTSSLHYFSPIPDGCGDQTLGKATSASSLLQPIISKFLKKLADKFLLSYIQLTGLKY